VCCRKPFLTPTNVYPAHVKEWWENVSLPLRGKRKQKQEKDEQSLAHPLKGFCLGHVVPLKKYKQRNFWDTTRVFLFILAVLVFARVDKARAANGCVLTVKETQIEVFLGLEDGIYPGQELYILRGKKILGKMTLTFVGEFTSWGEITSLETGVVPDAIFFKEHPKACVGQKHKA